ncbi:hypothetical protein B9Z55_019749 [Caenorhabditis nigoni]|uniref:TIL domain-containing protein n=1 Tax=Caenorhabditis nigoni TaxID=1611254 RepID=A0A2G5TJS7_9PELO|nr:hypothetical protein B9Z55_019749 [Caenorhabditis nigoni]
MISLNFQFVVLSIVIILIPFAFSLNSNSIDWCEYWARVGKKVSIKALRNAFLEQVANQNEFLKTDRPECAGYELPSGFKRTETFSCSKTEIYNCLDCEPTCHNLVPKCRKVRRTFATVFTIRDTRVQRSVQEQCNKGCVCKNGLARNSEGKCVTLRECAAQSPPKNDSVKVDEEDGTVMKTVKKMVPVIVNDVWKALFHSISTPDGNASNNRTKEVITPVLTPVEQESRKENLIITAPTGSEIKDEKHPQKGFYIDYP